MLDLISIIIPVYNSSVYLYQCLSSVQLQTYKNLEIIIIDDGSTDSSPEIYEYFRKVDKRFRVIKKNNGGLVSARKAGINACTGKFAFYVDGDDWLENNCIELLYKELKKNKADIAISNYIRNILGTEYYVDNLISPGIYNHKQIRDLILHRMISTDIFFRPGISTYSWGKLYRIDIIKEIQNAIPDNVILAEDALLVYPSIIKSNTIAILDKYLYNYRQRPNSILKSTNFSLQQEFNRLFLAKETLSRLLSVQKKNEFSFNRQINEYFSYLMLIRSGAFLFDLSIYNEFSIYSPIEKEMKIGIFGSGSFGQHIYSSLIKNPSLKTIIWIDPDFEENSIMNMDVASPKELNFDEIDILLIATFDPQIQKILLELLNPCKEGEKKIRFPVINKPLIEKLTKFNPELLRL
jgi:glycosyltransferase involved in cell wall biosynthesis